MKTIFEYTQSHVLVLPQALFAMSDVTVLNHHRNSALFYKYLEQDLVDIEFYTNTPCLIYIESGREVITNNQYQTIELLENDAIFLSQGLTLHSDFVKQTESLRAFLVFFDETVITEYLSKSQPKRSAGHRDQTILKLKDDGTIKQFFKTIHSDITDFNYLKIKLQELLHLIAWKDHQGILHTLLSTSKRLPKQQNLSRLLDNHDVLHLTVNDLAHISGRSLSSINRDFKAAYNLSPKKWLRDKKLARAKALLENGDISVTEAALTIGYENVSSFIKAFKLKYGETPNQIKQTK
ncbi:helix-turn-helix domain-containing protein [Photobacterium sp. TY1-4]|uniref:helix-turn-helix domain-containing protein n=1 Tax=Photobacterium sp. TY1-4 TaxID=2899122 RepID=UPI0021C06201|nr:response regulator transcription factor [Photobacterium sp. TY1-4]UXI02599.1 helix-turn-helix transcriptional regulator [Photobacterium sp. TY1-4]